MTPEEAIRRALLKLRDHAGRLMPIDGASLRAIADELECGLPDLQPLTLLPIVATSDAAKLYAQAVVDLINSLTGRHFKVTAETVTRAKALLRAKVKVDRMLAIVRFMAGKWSPDPKMAEYVQPSTLMRVSNAKKYGEMMDAGPARVRGGGGDFKMLGEE